MFNEAMLLCGDIVYRLTLGSQNGCSASLSATEATPGEWITVTVSPYTGYGNPSISVTPAVTITKVNTTTFKFQMPSANATVTANADALSYQVSVSAGTGGSASVNKTYARYGEQVTIGISPSAGYNLSSVSVTGATVTGSGNTRYFTMPARNVTVSVSFVSQYPGYTPAYLTIGTSPVIGGAFYGYDRDSGTYGTLEPNCNWTSLYACYVKLGSDFLLQQAILSGDCYINGIHYTGKGNDTDLGTEISQNIYNYFSANRGKTVLVFIKPV